jgi:CHAT domain-containing protein
LYAYELFGLQLDADMVVLSACETGTGKIAPGEGVLSMARAFRFAGARSVLMSLWKVDDAANASIMGDFYRLLGEGASKSEALRKAKLDYLDNSSAVSGQPFFWAAMVPMGEMAPLDLPRGQAGAPWAWVLLLGAGLTGGWVVVRRTSKSRVSKSKRL